MSITKRAFLAVTGLALLAAAGCTTVSGPSPEEEIRAMLDEYHAAQQSGEIEAIVGHFSDSFSNSMGGTKAVLPMFFQTLIQQNVFSNMTYDMENTVITVDGDTAVVDSVAYVSAMGTQKQVYQMAKEADGAWRITNSEVTP